MGAELKPCPFCGGDELSHGYSQAGIIMGNCECHTCNACLWADTEAEAITAWNTRAEQSLRPTAPLDFCNKCGFLGKAGKYGEHIKPGTTSQCEYGAACSPTAPDAVIFKGVGKIDGDGWKDVTRKGQIVYVWARELPSPYAPGQYPRVGCEGWSASTDQFDFEPATASDIGAIRAALHTEPAAPAPMVEGERSAAQFFFEVGYGACWAEAYVRNDCSPPFELSDGVIERAWMIAPEAHDDHEEFDRYLALADGATARQQGFDEAIERAAKVAEQWLEPIMATAHENDTYRSIATAIRNMGAGDGQG